MTDKVKHIISPKHSNFNMGQNLMPSVWIINIETLDRRYGDWHFLKLILCKVLSTHNIFEIRTWYVCIQKVTVKHNIKCIRMRILKYVQFVSYVLLTMFFYWYRVSQLLSYVWSAFCLEKNSNWVIALARALRVIKCIKIYKPVN